MEQKKINEGGAWDQVAKQVASAPRQPVPPARRPSVGSAGAAQQGAHASPPRSGPSGAPGTQPGAHASAGPGAQPAKAGSATSPRAPRPAKKAPEPQEDLWAMMAKPVSPPTSPSVSPKPHPQPLLSPSVSPNLQQQMLHQAAAGAGAEPAAKIGTPASAKKFAAPPKVMWRRLTLRQALEEVLPPPPLEYAGPVLGDGARPSVELAREIAEAALRGQALHAGYVDRVLALAWRHLKEECAPLMRTAVPEDGKLVVVGDLHGQLTDLVTILAKHGWPSETTHYLFNGDFIDRGPHGIEVLLVLYVLRMALPGSVFLNRGNHEEKYICEGYEFKDQVTRKYSDKEFVLACKTFKYLPLATLITDRSILVVHGGLPDTRGLPLSAIEQAKRVNPHDVEGANSNLLKALLWGDPRPEDGCEPNEVRGAGFFFGPDITAAFLSANKLRAIIRSHEVAQDGVAWTHGGQLATVFSASNYCGSSDNKGAVLVLQGEETLEYKYFASTSVDEQMSEKCKMQTVEMIRREIFAQRHKLVVEFSKAKSEHNGSVSVADFAAVMAKVIEPTLRWDVLWSYFTQEKMGRIHYVKFLDNYRIIPQGTLWTEWAEDIVVRLCQRMHETQNELKDAFSQFDTDGNGVLSYKEFYEALSKFSLGLTAEQIYDLFNVIDTDQSGTLSLKEFLGYFERLFQAATAKCRADSADGGVSALSAAALSDIGRVLRNNKIQIRRFFEQMDVDLSGDISMTEFRVGMSVVSKLLEAPLSEQQIEKLFKLIDSDGNGAISIEELDKAFSWKPAEVHLDGDASIDDRIIDCYDGQGFLGVATEETVTSWLSHSGLSAPDAVEMDVALLRGRVADLDEQLRRSEARPVFSLMVEAGLLRKRIRGLDVQISEKGLRSRVLEEARATDGGCRACEGKVPWPAADTCCQLASSLVLGAQLMVEAGLLRKRIRGLDVQISEKGLRSRVLEEARATDGGCRA
eukprot:m51a1_g13908 putative serine threonine-protein (972) ;mRNA; f:763693-768839